MARKHAKKENVPARPERRGPSTAKLIQDLRDLIHSARSEVVHAVTLAMALHYPQVGRRIRTDILDPRRAAYGEEIVSTLSRQLSAEFGSGYSRPNLFRMIKFAEFFVDGEIVSTLSRQLSWSHFIEIIRLKDALRRGLTEAGRWTGRSRRCSPFHDASVVAPLKHLPTPPIALDLPVARRHCRGPFEASP
jgi:DUF1016 N-terminal domain